MLTEEEKKNTGRMFVWSEKLGRLFSLKIASFEMAKVESNWSPFEFNGELYFIYMYNPMTIIKCQLENDDDTWLTCRSKNEVQKSTKSHEKDGVYLRLRGGSPLTMYHQSATSNFYLAAVHTTLWHSELKRYTS